MTITRKRFTHTLLPALLAAFAGFAACSSDDDAPEPPKPSGYDIYTAGYTTPASKAVATVWKNGQLLYTLTDGTNDAWAYAVCVSDGTVYAAGRINREQVPVYAEVPWAHDAAPEQVLVLHTLVVDPTIAGHGYGTQFVRFYARRARALGCTVLRIDTNAKNAAARRLYARLGFREAAIVPCTFNSIAGVELVCLEKRLDAE